MTRRASEREGKLVHMSFRVNEDIRKRLENAASKSGRSLTQEVERRLEQSFVWEDAFGDVSELRAQVKEKLDQTLYASVREALREAGIRLVRAYPGEHVVQLRADTLFSGAPDIPGGFVDVAREALEADRKRTAAMLEDAEAVATDDDAKAA